MNIIIDKNKHIKGVNEKEEFLNNILNIDISPPKTGFQIFNTEQRIKSFKERSTIVSQKWKHLSKLEKDEYEKKYKEDKIRYDKNMYLVKKYLLNPVILYNTRTPFHLFRDVYVNGDMNENGVDYATASEMARLEWNALTRFEKEEWKMQLKKEKDSLKDIKNYKQSFKSAYALFVHDRIVFNGKTRNEASEEWKSVGNNTKKKYEEKAKIENEENERIKDLFEIVNGLRPKRPNGPIALFMAELSNTNIKTENFLKEAHDLFRSLSSDKKKEYEIKHKILQLKYELKMKEIKNLNDKTKKTPSGFQLYFQEHKDKIKMNENEKFNIGQFNKKCHEAWLKEPERIREEFNNRAQKMKDSSLEPIYFEDKLIKPMKPYNSFTKNYLEVNKKILKDLKPVQRIERSAQAWKELKEEEKIKFQDQYEKQMKEYEESKDSNNFNCRNKASMVSMFRDQIQNKRLKSKNNRISINTENKERSRLAINLKKNIEGS